MSAVKLEIIEPNHNKPIVGDKRVTFRGQIVPPVPPDLTDVTLYYRWYSSLMPGDVEAEQYSMNEPASTNPNTPYTPETNLGIGSHVIVFAATDQPGETTAQQEQVQHGGITGGSEGAGACLVHVFKANLIKPTANAILNKSNTMLEAEAPLLWGKPIENGEGYEPNPDYHDLNRLQYRWEFNPTGSPTGRAKIDLIPTLNQLTFDPEAKPIVIRYSGALPNALNGSYTLTLHVEDKEGLLGGTQMSISIDIIN